MKLAYFHLTTADNDDTELGAAKVYGYVPPTCLLGGTLVWQIIKFNRRPCDSCNGPREKCKGTPELSILEESRAIDYSRLRALLKGDDRPGG